MAWRATKISLLTELEKCCGAKKVSLTLALIPAFSPEEKENRSPLHPKTRDWIGHAVFDESGDEQNAFPLLGERVRVREDVQTKHFGERNPG